jgi:hypothetical protein
MHLDIAYAAVTDSKMPAGQHNRVFPVRHADDTRLFLARVRQPVHFLLVVRLPVRMVLLVHEFRSMGFVALDHVEKDCRVLQSGVVDWRYVQDQRTDRRFQGPALHQSGGVELEQDMREL